ncbi:MAG: hypothetical protein ACJAY7_000446 [Pseudohongiellaceae bacterium]
MRHYSKIRPYQEINSALAESNSQNQFDKWPEFDQFKTIAKSHLGRRLLTSQDNWACGLDF